MFTVVTKHFKKYVPVERRTHERQTVDLFAVVPDCDVEYLGALQVHGRRVADRVRLCDVGAEGSCAVLADLDDGVACGVQIPKQPVRRV